MTGSEGDSDGTGDGSDGSFGEGRYGKMNNIPGFSIPRKIQIRTVSTNFYSIRKYEKGVKFAWGRASLIGPGGYFRFGFFPTHNCIKIVDMRDVAKQVDLTIQSKDHFEFKVSTDIRIKPRDALYIVQNEDRIDGFLERIIAKHINGICNTITETEGWVGNVYQYVQDLEGKMATDFGREGVMYLDTYMKLYCPEQFLAVAATRYGLKYYLEFNDKLRQHFLAWLEKETKIKLEAKEKIIKAIGEHPQMLVFGTFSEIFGEQRARSLQSPKEDEEQNEETEGGFGKDYFGEQKKGSLQSSEYRLIQPYIRGFLGTETAKGITKAYEKKQITEKAMSDTWRLNFFPMCSYGG